MKRFFRGSSVALGILGMACADNARTVGYLSDAASGGSSGSGGSTNRGGSPAAGATSEGGAGASSGGTTAGSGGKSTSAGGSGGETVDASQPHGGSGSTPVRDAAIDARSPKITLACWIGAPEKATETFDKACSVDGDCVVANHWKGCCSLTAVGVAATQKSAFDAFEEQTCGGAPPCGCCCDHTVAEDGNPVVANATARAVCSAGACTTVAQ